MASPIGGSSTGMSAIGSMLARPGGGQAPAAASSSPGAPGPGGGPPLPPGAQAADAQQQQLMQTIQGIRDLGEMVKQIAANAPMVSDEAQQIQELLKQMVIKAAQPAPVQTASSMMVPGNGGGA